MPRGPGKPPKVTEADVIEMRRLRWMEHWTYIRIAQKFSMSYNAVWCACNEYSWPLLEIKKTRNQDG